MCIPYVFKTRWMMVVEAHTSLVSNSPALLIMCADDTVICKICRGCCIAIIAARSPLVGTSNTSGSSPSAWLSSAIRLMRVGLTHCSDSPASISRVRCVHLPRTESPPLELRRLLCQPNRRKHIVLYAAWASSREINEKQKLLGLCLTHTQADGLNTWVGQAADLNLGL